MSDEVNQDLPDEDEVSNALPTPPTGDEINHTLPEPPPYVERGSSASGNTPPSAQ